MAKRHTRRTILRALPVVAFGLLSGCSDIVGSFTGPPPDLVVFNRTGGSISTSITVREQGGDSVLSEQTDIAPDQAAEYADALPASGDYTLEVETNGGLSGTHDWTISSENQSIQVRVRDDSVNFNTVSP